MVNVNYCILSGQLDIDKNYTHCNDCMGVQQLLNATFTGGGGGGGGGGYFTYKIYH